LLTEVRPRHFALVANIKEDGRGGFGVTNHRFANQWWQFWGISLLELKWRGVLVAGQTMQYFAAVLLQ
jgi:hypothetical protein